MFYFKQIKYLFCLLVIIRLKVFIIITIIEMELYHNILYRLLINNESKKTKNVQDIIYYMTEDNLVIIP